MGLNYILSRYMCANFSFQLASVISDWTVLRIIMY